MSLAIHVVLLISELYSEIVVYTHASRKNCKSIYQPALWYCFTSHILNTFVKIP